MIFHKYQVDYSVRVSLDQTDRMMDLKLAFMESKLRDLYDGVKFSLCYNSWGQTPTHVMITFDNNEDLMHWHLTFQDSILCANDYLFSHWISLNTSWT